ncbi:MAG: hypothetical protein ABSG36_06600 [Acidimicrobiales bacterium]
MVIGAIIVIAALDRARPFLAVCMRWTPWRCRALVLEAVGCLVLADLLDPGRGL